MFFFIFFLNSHIDVFTNMVKQPRVLDFSDIQIAYKFAGVTYRRGVKCVQSAMSGAFALAMSRQLNMSIQISQPRSPETLVFFTKFHTGV